MGSVESLGAVNRQLKCLVLYELFLELIPGQLHGSSPNYIALAGREGIVKICRFVLHPTKYMI